MILIEVDLHLAASFGRGQGRRVMTYIVEVGTELCSETMLEKCTIG